MKRFLLFIIFISFFSSIKANQIEDNSDKRKEKDKKDVALENPECTVSCSVTLINLNGVSVTHTTSAGGWFTSCEKASKKCLNKLMHEVLDIGLGNKDYTININ